MLKPGFRLKPETTYCLFRAVYVSIALHVVVIIAFTSMVPPTVTATSLGTFVGNRLVERAGGYPFKIATTIASATMNSQSTVLRSNKHALSMSMSMQPGKRSFLTSRHVCAMGRTGRQSKSSLHSHNLKPFRTEIQIPKSSWLLQHNDNMIFIGSCFSEVISHELSRRKFSVIANPQGISFNPWSIAGSMDNIATKKCFDINDIFADNVESGIFHSWHHHSAFSGSDPDSLLESMNAKIAAAHKKLIHAKCIFVTFGSAFVHELKSQSVIVANCHKQPSTLFKKKLMRMEEIVAVMTKAIDTCHQVNPHLKFVITVSPIRHTREGIPQNQLSKSTLICAAHALVSERPNSVSYFPSYECVMDDLRDYRFYADDMIHPSKIAEEYILSKFADCYFSEETIELCNKILALQTSIEHRPIVSDSKGYQKHVERTLESLTALETKFGNMFADDVNFEPERLLLQRRLS